MTAPVGLRVNGEFLQNSFTYISLRPMACHDLEEESHAGSVICIESKLVVEVRTRVSQVVAVAVDVPLLVQKTSLSIPDPPRRFREEREALCFRCSVETLNGTVLIWA
jgi:hypothetical protein